MLLDLKSLMELGYSCAQGEDLGSWLSNTDAPSVFSDMQSSLKEESNPIDKLSVLILSGKPKTSVLLIQFEWDDSEHAEESNSCNKKSVTYCLSK